MITGILISILSSLGADVEVKNAGQHQYYQYHVEADRVHIEHLSRNLQNVRRIIPMFGAHEFRHADAIDIHVSSSERIQTPDVLSLLRVGTPTLAELDDGKRIVIYAAPKANSLNIKYEEGHAILFLDCKNFTPMRVTLKPLEFGTVCYADVYWSQYYGKYIAKIFRVDMQKLRHLFQVVVDSNNGQTFVFGNYVNKYEHLLP